MARKKIIVTGAAGQLGSALKKIESLFSDFELIFLSRNSFDLSNPDSVSQNIDFDVHAVINTAAYTAVDYAESNQADAWQTNVLNTVSLARHCNAINIPLIHFSSDYVYDNGKNTPLKETDSCHPKSVYAFTKFEGEQAALYYNSKTIIIRTSWVYSEFGNNFVKTILKLIKEKPEINVVNDQIGAPTYAIDLAIVSLKIVEKILIKENPHHYGIYNFSNSGPISWFDFASEIARLSGSECKIKPVPTAAFPRPAPRPTYSLFDLSKIKNVFGISPMDWKKSLKICVQNLAMLNH